MSHRIPRHGAVSLRPRAAVRQARPSVAPTPHAVPARTPVATRTRHTVPTTRATATPAPLPPTTQPTIPLPQPEDPACHAAARARTSAAQLEHMVALRRSGLSLRQIGRQVGRCMEGVRQALMRYEQAREDIPPTTPSLSPDEDWTDPLREPEPLPPGHPIAMRGLWRGLEHWRGLV